VTNRLDPWVLKPRRVQGPSLRLFCFPYAGAGTSAFRQWSADLPIDIELCCVELPGRETRYREAPFTRVADLIEAASPFLRPHMSAPFALFGHSMGALLCFELARELRRLGGPAPLHLFVSGALAPHLPDPEPPLHDLPDREFLDEVGRRYDGIPPAVLEHPDLVQLLLPVLRADVTILETYVYRDEPPLDCPMTALGGLDDRHVKREDLAAWSEHTSGPFAMELFPGNHFFIQSAKKDVLRLLGNTLDGCRRSTALSFP
jgi:medium-chain acyl-[acyl-carrier-protein] hydrolase